MSELIDNRSHRIRTLKELIQELHRGADPDEVRVKLRTLVRETSSSEIAAMEQELHKVAELLEAYPALEEALVASTINAAYALDRQTTVGSLELGKQLDFVMLQGPLVDLLRIGAPAIALVVKGGRVVVDHRKGSAGSS